MDEIVREFLVESYENLDQLDQDLVALEHEPGSRELLGRIFRTIHTIKGTCGFLAFSRLEHLTHAGESLLCELRDGRRAMDGPTTDLLLALVDTVRKILASIDTSGVEGDTAVDALAEQLRAVLESPVDQIAPAVVPPAPSEGSVADELNPASLSDSAIRVDVAVLDALMRQVGELVLARNQITRLAAGNDDADLVQASQRLSLITSGLQEGVMTARMQPIGHLWVKMPRVVRDLAALCGRQVHLEVAGGDTELDRALLEAVKDPLMHLVRNAVDHGIEAADARVAAGKPADGILAVRAYHAGGQVVVEVEDDGRGIDAELIAATAVARQLRTSDQVARMSPTELIRLLFVPGFSMAEAVTSVSGRGVGLDVVRDGIEAVGGTVEVDSTVGSGTTFRLRIPLTLAVIPALVVTTAGESYAIPAASVLEFVAVGGDLAGARIEYVGRSPVFRLRGTLLPLVDLAGVLGLAGKAGSVHGLEAGESAVMAVLQVGTRRFGLIIDAVLATEEIVVKPLPARLGGVGFYAGAALLGDGRVCLILDVEAIAGQSLHGHPVEVDLHSGTEPPTPVEVPEQVLLIGLGAGRRAAMPLRAVTRLERVPRDVIEHVGGREVLQYREGIVPLIRLDRLLCGETDLVREDDEERELLVVMSTRGAHCVAIAVTEVLDIVDDDVTRHSEIDDRGVVGSSVMGDRVTELLDMRQVVLSGDPRFFDDPPTANHDGVPRDAVEV